MFWSFNAERGADLGSVWLIIDQLRDSGVAVDTDQPVVVDLLRRLVHRRARARPAGGRRTDHVPRLAQLGFLIVVGFLLVNKVYSPQYVLWLLPLAVLARPRWRDQIIWQAGEVFYFASVWWYLGGYLQPAGGGDAGFYWVAIVVRMAVRALPGRRSSSATCPAARRTTRWATASSDAQLMTTRSNVVAV